ncbi:DMT family transporter [Calothrix sp. NIES-3974]|uniref:DMT family transporter n=1 Tax=Calothrix sp. NIES-3974 TaxID=2005462 RepID=UPI000B60E559|nr:DMT family transporter [Calothrix sp. NIES-3974]BAZ05345.1 hypothetical protein NIES3974_19920 [Calothrix sp. NIES-3974]
MHQTSGRWRLGLGLSLMTVFLWGILPIALTITLQAVDIYSVTWFRFLVSFLLLGIYLTWSRQLPPIQQFKTTTWQLLAIATLFLALNYIFFLQGLALTSATTAQVIIQLAPFLMGLGGLIFFRERYTLPQWLGVVTLITGFVLFFHEKLVNLQINTEQFELGILSVVIAALAWAIYALAQKQLLQQLSSAQIMLIIYGGCSCLFVFFITTSVFQSLSPLHWFTLGFCALNTLIAYGCFSESLQHWEASRVSALVATTPIVTFLSVLISSRLIPQHIAPEILSLSGICGGVLVVTGSIVTALGKRNHHFWTK